MEFDTTGVMAATLDTTLESGGTQSPVMADAGDPSQEVFEVLSEQHRVEIVQVLADHLREHPEDPAMGFSDLRRAVGMRDSGNFNYHLQQLTGQFVLQTDDGYRLGPAGLQVVAALVSGVYGEGVELGPLELDDDCPACGDTLTATYADGTLTVTCPDDHRFRNALPPGAVDDRSLSEVVQLLTRKTRHDMELVLTDSCPFCYAHLDWTADVDTDDPMPQTESQCDRCGVLFEIPVVFALVEHPQIAAFYHDHGIDVRTAPLWTPAYFDAVEVAECEDGYEARVELDGDTIEAVVDDSLTVVAVHE